jgi:hypothetical protein
MQKALDKFEYSEKGLSNTKNLIWVFRIRIDVGEPYGTEG